jgi:hypothetical protein
MSITRAMLESTAVMNTSSPSTCPEPLRTPEMSRTAGDLATASCTSGASGANPLSAVRA